MSWPGIEPGSTGPLANPLLIRANNNNNNNNNNINDIKETLVIWNFLNITKGSYLLMQCCKTLKEEFCKSRGVTDTKWVAIHLYITPALIHWPKPTRNYSRWTRRNEKNSRVISTFVLESWTNYTIRQVNGYQRVGHWWLDIPHGWSFLNERIGRGTRAMLRVCIYRTYNWEKKVRVAAKMFKASERMRPGYRCKSPRQYWDP